MPAIQRARIADLPPKTVNWAPFMGSGGFDTICTAVCNRCDSSTACRLYRLLPICHHCFSVSTYLTCHDRQNQSPPNCWRCPVRLRVNWLLISAPKPSVTLFTPHPGQANTHPKSKIAENCKKTISQSTL